MSIDVALTRSSCQWHSCADPLVCATHLLAGIPCGRHQVSSAARIDRRESRRLYLATQPDIGEAIVVLALASSDEVVPVGAVRPGDRQTQAITHGIEVRSPLDW